jgi:hypothetical protein
MANPAGERLGAMPHPPARGAGRNGKRGRPTGTRPRSPIYECSSACSRAGLATLVSGSTGCCFLLAAARRAGRLLNTPG